MLVVCKNYKCQYYDACLHIKPHEPKVNSLRGYCNIPWKHITSMSMCMCVPIIDNKELDRILDI